MIRAYQALGEAVVEATAHIRHDAMGQPCEPVSLFLGRAYYDATGSVNADDVALWLSMMFQNADTFVGPELGGWHSLL